MRGVREDTIAKISWGILGSMALGLMVGTQYIVSLSNASDLHAGQIKDLQSAQSVTPQMQTDIAVIKEQVHQIKQILENK